jgi:hypothetical protein
MASETGMHAEWGVLVADTKGNMLNVEGKIILRKYNGLKYQTRLYKDSKGVIVNANGNPMHRTHAGVYMDDASVIKDAVKRITLYFVFLFFYTIQSVAGLHADNYWLGANVIGQFGGNEFMQPHSPTFGKTFTDIASVEEVYHWMLGPFAQSAFAPGSFDGDGDWEFQDGKVGGTILGYNTILGAIKISQLRVVKDDCSIAPFRANRNTTALAEAVATEESSRVAAVGLGAASAEVLAWRNAEAALAAAKLDTVQAKMHCYGNTAAGYGASRGDFSVSSEDTSAFSNYTEYHWPQPLEDNIEAGPLGIKKAHGPFLYDGMHYDGRDAVKTAKSLPTTVAQERAKLMSAYEGQRAGAPTYPDGAFAITLNPKMGADKALETMRNLVESKYIDLHTRAVFVDISVYNLMMDRMLYVRMVLEMTKAGGVIPSYDFNSFNLFATWFGDTAFSLFLGCCRALVVLFYVGYAWEEFKVVRRMRWKVLHEPLHILQILNIIFFIVSTSMVQYSSRMVPLNVDVSGEVYTPFYRCMKFRAHAMAVQGFNVFLNWFKLIGLLSFSPTFAVMSTTLGRAVQNTASFMVIFTVVHLGFSMAHFLLFGSKLFAFSTLKQSALTLIRSLLGDFDFVALKDANAFMGPLLFVLFIGVSVFVVLNMFIAIISDAYEECKQEQRIKPQVKVWQEVKALLKEILLRQKGAAEDASASRPATAATRPGTADAAGGGVGLAMHAMGGAAAAAPGAQLEASAGVTAGANAQDAVDLADEVTSMQAGAAMLSNPSMILVEWYDSLKAHETDTREVQREVFGLQKEMFALQKTVDQGFNDCLQAVAGPHAPRYGAPGEAPARGMPAGYAPPGLVAAYQPTGPPTTTSARGGGGPPPL